MGKLRNVYSRRSSSLQALEPVKTRNSDLIPRVVSSRGILLSGPSLPATEQPILLCSQIQGSAQSHKVRVTEKSLNRWLVILAMFYLSSYYYEGIKGVLEPGMQGSLCNRDLKASQSPRTNIVIIRSSN